MSQAPGSRGVTSSRAEELISAVQGELVAALKRADVMRQEAEQAREALERSHAEKDEFLAMLAHELRNPLGPISNAAEILQAAVPDDPSIQRATEILVRQTGLLTRLVDDLLDAARISAGKLELRRTTLDLGALVRSVVDDVRDIFVARQLELHAALPDGPLWVDGDPQRLTQAVGNLLSNAAKFTDPGGTVRVELAPDEDGDEASLTISDTGIGMSDDLVRRVFDSFSQAAGNVARNPSGLGLGTAIARGIVELHEGSVSASSAGIGAGSTFMIRLPLVAAETAARRAGARAVSTPAGSARVVVIDDNVDAAEVLQVMLETLSHTVSIAHDAASGAALARRLAPDVVLCDIGLPGETDGFGVARLLAAQANSPYLVALTGYGSDEDRRRSREAGFDEHVTKPVSLETLERVVSAAQKR